MKQAAQLLRKLYRANCSVLQYSQLSIPIVSQQNQWFSGRKMYSTGSGPKGVYELRTYSIVPAKMAEYQEFLKNNFHLRIKHSKMSAFWIVELGAVNQCVHMWYYDDMNARAAVRSKMAQNEEWKTQFLPKVTPMLQLMENQLLTPFPASPVPKFPQTTVYDIHFYTMIGHSHQWNQEVEDVTKSFQNISDTKTSSLSGVWSSQVGQENLIVTVWNHNSPNDVITLRSKLDQNDTYKLFLNKVQSKYSKMLNPALLNMWG